MHPLWTSRSHLLQQLQKSPLPQVSDRRPRTLARSTPARTSPRALRPCGLHPASATGCAGSAQQENHLWFAAPGQCRNPSGSGSHSQTSRGRDRLLQRAAHLKPKIGVPSSCPLRDPRRWTVARSNPLGAIPLSLLSPHRCAASCLSRQVRGWSQVRLPTQPAPLLWRPGPLGSAENLCFLVASTVQKRLGGLLQTTLRRPRVCAPASGPVHPSRHQLQPSTDLIRRRPSDLSLARLRS